MRLAYISHVDSRWIKQRPQFLAEALDGEGLSVSYICSVFVRRRMLVRGQKLAVPVLRVPLLPQRFRTKLGKAEWIAAFAAAFIIMVRASPTVVIVTHTRHYRLARALRAWGVRVYYDCMDLNGQFPDSVLGDARDEAQLVRQSEMVFCSSLQIEQHILRLDPDAQTISVLNALDPESFAFPPPGSSVDLKTVGYVGTVSDWFDFDIVLALLAADPEIVVDICGPSHLVIPAHERIRPLGILSHAEALDVMRRCAVLILPFHVNELVEAVDPVKVYEYVATGRPVVAANYPQLDHFGNLINRYSSATEFVFLVRRLLEAAPLEELSRRQFIKANSWSERAAIVRNQLLACSAP